MKTYNKALHITDEDFSIKFSLNHEDIDVTTRGAEAESVTSYYKWVIDLEGAIQRTDGHLLEEYERAFEDSFLNHTEIMVIVKTEDHTFIGPVRIESSSRDMMYGFPPGDKITIEMVSSGVPVVEPEKLPCFLNP